MRRRSTHSSMAQFKLGSMIILKILGMAMLCEGYKSYSKNIPNDARNMNRGSNITHRSLFEICSSAIQTQLKIRTQRQRGFLKSLLGPKATTKQIQTSATTLVSISPVDVKSIPQNPSSKRFIVSWIC